MKYATLIALTATVSARYLVDGATAENVQDQVINAGEDAAEFMETDMIPNLDQYGREQEIVDQTWGQASEKTFNDFVARGDAANYDAKLDNISRQIDQAMNDLEANVNANHRAGNFARRTAGATKLWSVGMTATKTAAVNTKLQKVAQDAMAFGSDPVYGPFIEQHQTVLMNEITAAFTKYQTAMEAKYNSDPVFRAKADALVASDMALGNELENEAGWTFEDNDGALNRAASQW